MNFCLHFAIDNNRKLIVAIELKPQLIGSGSTNGTYMMYFNDVYEYEGICIDKTKPYHLREVGN